MKTKKNLWIIVGLSIICFAGIGAAQSLKETQALVKGDVTITWEDSWAGVTEFQSVEFKEDNMVVTRRSVFKDRRENIQTAIIPVARIDVSRMNSYAATNPEGMYYLSIFTDNDEDAIKVTTFFAKDTSDSIVETYYYTLYSKTQDKNLLLKEKIEELVYLLKKSR